MPGLGIIASGIIPLSAPLHQPTSLPTFSFPFILPLLPPSFFTLPPNCFPGGILLKPQFSPIFLNCHCANCLKEMFSRGGGE